MSDEENFGQKVQSPLLKDVLTPQLITVTTAFLQSGYDIRLVGGVVRDLLLNVPSKDIDLSTNATPEQMKDVFLKNGIKFIETGLEHGTLTAHVNNVDFEVTTLRYDTDQDGRWAKVVFTDDWKLDAERRDLTINAMSMDTECTLYDYFNGVDDLKCRRIRFVGDSRQRIKEDYLRILRYFRFYGRIARDEDKHDKQILEAIKETAQGLEKIAVERIWMELSKILVGNFAPSLGEHPYLGDLLTMVINHLLTGMILQVRGSASVRVVLQTQSLSLPLGGFSLWFFVFFPPSESLGTSLLSNKFGGWTLK